MANKVLNITGDQIRNMSEQEWLEYRKNKWLKKREYYSKDMPDYYLANRESYAKVLDRLEKRISKAQEKNK